MSDLFADLLKGTGTGTANFKTESNLSLNEKISSSNASFKVDTNNNSALDLDFLDSYMSKSKPNANASSKVASLEANKLLFADLNISNKTQGSATQITEHLNNTGNLLDDFFGTNVAGSSSIDTSGVESPSMMGSMVDYNEPKPNKPIEVLKPQRTPSFQDKKDNALAELIDMGFPIEKANEALQRTQSGYDVNGAISHLMDAAHSSSRQTTRVHRFNEPESNDFVNEISTNILSTASFLFNSGKKKIQQGVEMYRKQTIENNGGQPLWMKNQHQYKANSTTVPGWRDEESEEMHPEVMRQLMEKQRLREQKLKQEKKQRLTSTVKEGRGEPEERVHRSSTPSDEIYVSSARHRTKKPAPSSTNTSLLSTPPMAKPATQPLQVQEEVDLLGFGSLSHSNSSFSIPPLNSAQKMTFTDSRTIAQENFKNGDFTKSLENYLEAGKLIPLDHPYQIIIYSNLALLYSKLGDAKEQLLNSDKGLALISSIMESQKKSVSELTSLKLEEGKNLKSFWNKLMLKRAESLEFLEKWSDSKTAYEELIKNGESSKTVMDGKNRCNKMLNPTIQKSKPKSQSLTTSNTTISSINPSNEKLQRVKESGVKKQKEDEEKFQLHDKVESKLDAWRQGNKDNIRALICSLDSILWPELNWKPVKLTDLVMDNKVKINYMKAVAKTHPDKISSTESMEKKMIANGVFITLNEAWESFKVSKGM